MSEEIIQEVGEQFKNLLRERFNPYEEKDFSLRMSNIGRPLCQLWMEKNKVPKSPLSYNHSFKMVLGDVVEVLAVAVLKAAGVNVEEWQKKVELPIGDTKIKGTLDVKIDGGVYDIKSASPFAFQHKFDNPRGFSKLLEDDPFGYVSQGYLYGKADNADFKGWIAIEKSTGEWTILETPYSSTGYAKSAAKEAATTIEHLNEAKEFRRCFEPENETFNGKETGNKVLPLTCAFCSWKEKCWEGEGLVHADNPRSKARYPQKRWYLGTIK